MMWLTRCCAVVCPVALVSACAVATSPPSPTSPRLPTPQGWETEALATLGATPAPVPVVLGLPYKPDVQFTPLYVAEANGYFRDAGLAVTLRYGDESAFVRLVAAREMSAVIASGEQVILARANAIPVKYVLTWYERFPVVVFSDDPDLADPAALVGRTVGLPASSGASYIGWQALLHAHGIDARSVRTEVIGFQQLEAVLQGRVDAAVGYAANEPVQLRRQGIEPAVIEVADAFNLVSNGLVVSDDAIMESRDIVQALVAAIVRGLSTSLADPDAAFEIAVATVPEIGAPEVRDAQRAVLEESLRFWRADTIGGIDVARWQASADFLARIGLVPGAIRVEEMIDQTFVSPDGADR